MAEQRFRCATTSDRNDANRKFGQIWLNTEKCYPILTFGSYPTFDLSPLKLLLLSYAPNNPWTNCSTLFFKKLYFNFSFLCDFFCTLFRIDRDVTHYSADSPSTSASMEHWMWQQKSFHLGAVWEWMEYQRNSLCFNRPTLNLRITHTCQNNLVLLHVESRRSLGIEAKKWNNV